MSTVAQTAPPADTGLSSERLETLSQGAGALGLSTLTPGSSLRSH